MKIFLSYARQDAATASELADALETAGHEPWVDTVGLQGGDVWSAKIVDRINECDVLVVLLSRTSVRSDNVGREVQLAAQAGKRILPVRLDDVEPTGTLAYSLVGIHRIDLFANRDTGRAALVASLDNDSPSPDVTVGSATPNASNGRSWRRPSPVVVGAAGAVVLAFIVGVIALTNRGDNGGTDEVGNASDGIGAESVAGPDSDELGEFCGSAIDQLDQLAGGNELTGRDLRRCDLDGADLSGTDLTSTNLEGASLRGADLSGALLATMVLTGADLTDATVTGAHLYRVEFEDAVGLDTIDWADALVERSVCDDGPCLFDDAITINRSLLDCSATDYALGAPIASAALGIPVLWIDDDGDCLHDDYEREFGTLPNERDTTGSGRPDSIDGQRGSEKPLSLFTQITYLGR